MKWERRRGQRSCSNCMHIPKFGTDKITWKLSQHNLSQGPDQTPRYSKYETGVLPTRRWNSMHRVSLYSLWRPLNPLTPNDLYSGRTAPLTSKRYILYIYSTNIVIEYFKRGIYSPFCLFKMQFFHNSNVFGSCTIHILYTGCSKI